MTYKPNDEISRVVREDFADSKTKAFDPPSLTTTERDALVDLSPGGLIWNSTLSKLQVYNGSAWETISSS